MKNKKEDEVVFITFDQASDLVERIAERAKRFDYEMSEPEKGAMAQLLSDIGVKVSDLVDASYLADNYAINAEIVGPDEVAQYEKSSLRAALFTWQENGETHYCLSW